MSIVFVRQKILRSLLTVVCAISLPVSAAWAAGSVQVTVDKLNVRSGPSLQDAIVTTLPNKTVLPVISTKNEWIQVKLPNGQSGWVANWLVNTQQQQQQQKQQQLKPATTSAKQVESTTTSVNVRSGPGQTYAVVQTINPGTRYPIVQQSGEWIQIQLNAGTKGWVANWLVKEAGTGQAVSPPSTGSTPPATNPAGTVSQTKPPAVQGASLTLDFAPYVYATPDASTPAIGQLHAGEKITVLNRQNGWVQFPYDGVNAWLSTDQTNPDTGQPTLPENGNGSTPPQTGQPSSSSQTATVKTDGLNLRSEPNTTSAIQATLPVGSKLTVLESRGDWYRINTAAGKTGWVAGWHITVNQPNIPTPNGPYVTIMNPDTNVRSGPSTDHDVIKQVQPGEKYGIANKSGEWFQVNFLDGSTGYIAGWLVSANGAQAVVRSNDLAGKVIVVDAGHGGTDGGSTGSSFSTLEKTVNLQVSLLLRNKLESAGAKVIMTRADDRKLTLQQRVDIAIQNQADIFVSVHHNTHPNSATNGSIIFYYSQGNSSKLASLVQTELVKATNYKDMNYRYGNYFVLRENPVPSILAEISFLSNYNDEIRARSEKQQDLAAEGLFKGIVQYFNTQSNQGG
ncbi:SH3 domain-containing protein [Brevibacillus fortis]|uniref:SH3 domain-containing protein n=1 Tax=Brevibacillus fortis TaxID=2126352 RepID=UPI0038FD0876